jgi:nucleoside 2-deoxyribosyltransferase
VNKKVKSLYVIGSLRNPSIAKFSNELASLGIEAFSSWAGAGKFADDEWKSYQTARGLNYGQALKEYATRHVFSFDKYHLDRTDGAVLLLPAGRSGHLELGYTLGRGKPGFIVFEKMPKDRWDVMYCFATAVYFSRKEFLQSMRKKWTSKN